MSESVTVGVRVRPLNNRELSGKNPDISWRPVDNAITRVDAATGATPSAPQTFHYDSVFDKHSANEDVYTTFAAPVVAKALGGFNATIFAYGQTSSGKTHSMLGSPEEPGITPLAIQHVLQSAKNSRTRSFLVRVVYVEIYNDKIRDLLNPSAGDLAVREDKAGRVFVDAHETVVQSLEDAMAVLDKGQAARHVGETKMNARSSRSHTVFTLLIESKSVEGLDESFRASSLNLVDLAGSERLKSTGAAGTRQKEGAHINQSLLTLGTIINRLSAAGPDAAKLGHLPYRDSKLTRLLRPALGGNARLAVLCAITPSAAHAEETLSTLKFAARAKKVTNNARRNEVVDYRAKYREASTEVAVLRERFQSMEHELSSLRSEMASAKILIGRENREEGGTSRVTPSSSASDVTPALDEPKDRDDEKTAEQEKKSKGEESQQLPTSPASSRMEEGNSSNAMDSGVSLEVDTAREVALRTARDEVKFLKAHVGEMESENEHLKDRLSAKAIEFSQMRARAVELRCAARRARSNERMLQQVVKRGFDKLENARKQLEASRKKGAHVKVAEGLLEELSEQLMTYLPEGSGLVVEGPGNGAIVSKGSSKDSEKTQKEDRTEATKELVSRLGDDPAVFGGKGAMIGIRNGWRDGMQSGSSPWSGSGSRSRRPRPLPDDMVADIDDSGGEEELKAKKENSGPDDSGGLMRKDSLFKEEPEEGTEGGAAFGGVEAGGGRASGSVGGDSGGEVRRRKKNKWHVLRSFYGYRDGVFDNMMDGHKLESKSSADSTETSMRLT